MTSNHVLKWYLKKSIHPLIETLQRRIDINTSTSAASNRQGVGPSGNSQDRLRAIQALYHQHKDVQRIISECNETIGKMRLIQLALDYADIHLLLHLFTNHSLYSHEDMLAVIGLELPSNTSTCTEDYVMVA